MVWRFSGFELDEKLYQLRRGGEVIKLEPKVFDLLFYLFEQRDRVVSKDELLDRVWAGQHVSESVLPRNIRVLRKVLGDDRASQRFIETAHGRGYRFAAKVVEEGGEANSAADGNRDPFVGRAPVMEELHAALASAAAGSGELVLLVGEPGIGKTRTAEEFSGLARAQGTRVLPGHCYEGDGAPAFWPWIQVLRASLRDRDPKLLLAELGSSGSDLIQLLPELSEHLSAPVGPPPSDSQQVRFRLFDAVASYLSRASETQPLLILIDDLHWADKSSLLLLRFVARELRDAKVLIAACYRDIELRRGHPLGEALGELARETRCRRIHLRGLERDGVAEYLRGVAGREVGAELVASLYDRTEGNPFFMGEMVRLMLQEGEGVESEPGTFSQGRLPEGVREAIGRRLSGLSTDCNRVLGAAAFLGREFSLAPLENLVELPRERLLGLLDEAQEMSVIAEVPRTVGHYSFAHALVRETLYEEVSAPLRAKMHMRAGEILETLHSANLTPLLPELANHFFQAAAAGQVDKAVIFGRRAAEHAMTILAWEEAAQQYERVLEALGLAAKGDAKLRCEVLLALGDAYSRAGERALAREKFGEAADLARELDEPESLARAALGFSARDSASRPDDVLRQLLEDALAGVGSADSAWRAALLARLSVTYPHSKSLERASAQSLEALEIARRCGARWALSQALDIRAHYLRPFDTTERLAIGSELLEIAHKPDDVEGEFALHDPAWSGRNCRLAAQLLLGDAASADLELAAMARMAEQQRQPFQHRQVYVAHFARSLAAGKFDDARDWIRRTREISARMDPLSNWYPFMMEFALGRECGTEHLPDVFRQPDDFNSVARSFFEIAMPAALDRYEGRDSESILDAIRTEQPLMAAIATALVGHTRMQLGERDEAQRELSLLREGGFSEIPKIDLWLLVMGLAAELAAYLDDRESAEEIYALLGPFAHLSLRDPLQYLSLGPVSHFLGILAAVSERPEAAIRHFEVALEHSNRMQARAHLTRTQLEMARALASLGKQGPARTLRQTAQASARELGMTTLLG